METYLISLVGFYYFYVIAIGLYMFVKRSKAVKNRELKGSYFKSYQGPSPEYLKVLENHYNNQFQIPVVFMVTTVFGLIIEAVTPMFLLLSFFFVASRVGHSYIHLTSNNIVQRAGLYFAGVITLGALWLIIFADLY